MKVALTISSLPKCTALVLAFLAASVGCLDFQAPALLDSKPTASNPHVIAFENGLWYDGETFVPGTRFSVDGLWAEAPPTSAALSIDLRGRHVVPPYGEAHTHLLEADLIENYVQHYLHRGVFYAKVQAGIPFLRRQLELHLNGPDSFDFVSANQGFTGPGGHPLQILDLAQQLGWLPAEWTLEEIDGNAIFLVDSLTDLDEKWPRFLESRPDFVKVFLHYSEAHQERKDDPKYRYRRGLDPALVAPIVQRAHAAGLEVSAHGFSAADFRTALDAEVDHFAHFPGTGYDPELGEEAFRITEEDARRAARGGITVTTTFADLVGGTSDLDDEMREYFDRVLRPNFEKLAAAGVPILLGSDLPRMTTDVEASIVASLGLLGNRELLRSWCVETPRRIFPGRKIGRLDDGYEASFLVLDGNPIEDFTNTQRIVLRVKLGRLLFPRELEFPPISGS